MKPIRQCIHCGRPQDTEAGWPEVRTSGGIRIRLRPSAARLYEAAMEALHGLFGEGWNQVDFNVEVDLRARCPRKAAT